MWTAILTARCFTVKQQKYFQGAQTIKEQRNHAHCNDPFVEPFQETLGRNINRTTILYSILIVLCLRSVLFLYSGHKTTCV